MSKRITRKERTSLEKNPDMSINELRAINASKAVEALVKFRDAHYFSPYTMHGSRG